MTTKRKIPGYAVVMPIVILAGLAVFIGNRGEAPGEESSAVSSETALPGKTGTRPEAGQSRPAPANAAALFSSYASKPVLTEAEKERMIQALRTDPAKAIPALLEIIQNPELGNSTFRDAASRAIAEFLAQNPQFAVENFDLVREAIKEEGMGQKLQEDYFTQLGRQGGNEDFLQSRYMDLVARRPSVELEMSRAFINGALDKSAQSALIAYVTLAARSPQIAEFVSPDFAKASIDQATYQLSLQSHFPPRLRDAIQDGYARTLVKSATDAQTISNAISHSAASDPLLTSRLAESAILKGSLDHQAQLAPVITEHVTGAAADDLMKRLAAEDTGKAIEWKSRLQLDDEGKIGAETAILRKIASRDVTESADYLMGISDPKILQGVYPAYLEDLQQRGETEAFEKWQAYFQEKFPK